MFRWRKPRSEVVAFRVTVDGEALVLALHQDGRPVEVEHWTALRPQAASAVAALRAAGDECEAAVQWEQDLVRLAPDVVASLDGATAAALDLPPTTSLALDLRPVGRIDQDDFRIAVRWVQPGGSGARCQVQGAMLRSESGVRRIPEPLFSIYRSAQALSEPRETSKRFRILADLQRLWPEEVRPTLQSDAYLQDIRVHYAAAVSLKLRTLTPETTEFDPVLFGTSCPLDEEGRTLDEEADSLLAPAAQKLFAEKRFRQESVARPAYVLGGGEYVFVDPALRPALTAVRRLQDGPEADRRRLVLNPRQVLREVLGDAIADQTGLDRVFVETEQFSARVSGVDLWRAPVLPWLQPAPNGGWLPERFGLRLGEHYFTLAAGQVGTLADRVAIAQADGSDCVPVADLLGVPPGHEHQPPAELPLTDQLIASVEALRSYAQVEPSGGADASTLGPDATAGPRTGKLFLVVHDNFEQVDYAPASGTGEPVEPIAPVPPPDGIRTPLKPHQQHGLNWLAAAAKSGLPGVLLADDMGLGKTLQAISFLAWLRAEAAARRAAAGPVLIVAPTGLLGTWRQEIDHHLSPPALGDLVPAFAGGLRQLREESGLGAKDIESGKAALSAGAWNDAGVVLTTYETMRDYHFSFAKTRFSAIVFDEIQKLKNPASQVTRAAKALNGDFLLGMTGTPVENRLQDLWSIMDVVTPGMLGSSRQFELTYGAKDADKLAELKRRLCDSNGAPPVLLRRMKSQVLEGLPKKHVHRSRITMPPAQATSYRDLIVRAAAATQGGTLGRGGMLSTLAEMRGVSLHPIDPRQAPGDLDAYVEQSARLSHTLALLGQIAAKREKALLFVEDLAMQERLAALVQTRFGLTKPPMRISGAVPGPQRQRIVDLFQAGREEFDVLILSPKAGGVGLTLTAANHVIHLSRWWNPAVEDQATDRVFRIGQERDVHIYLPLAVHPDPAIADASFDLRLDALLERKRALTEQLFLPPDAADDELDALFREVAFSEAVGSQDVDGLDRAAPGNGGAADDHVTLSDAAAPASMPPAARPTLTIATPLERAEIRVWWRKAGEARPTDEVAALFAGKDIGHVIVRDPYCLGSAASRLAQIRFVRMLAERSRQLEAVTIEYDPDIDGDIDEPHRRRAVGEALAQAFPGGAPRLNLVRRRRRAHGDDFHDRFVDIDVRHAGGAVKRHALSIGRGLEALFDNSKQCTLTYAPPSED